MVLGKPGCYFKGASIHFHLVEDAPVEVTIFTVSGREVYRNRIPMQSKGLSVKKISAEKLHSGCYLALVKIGEKIFKGKMFIQK